MSSDVISRPSTRVPGDERAPATLGPWVLACATAEAVGMTAAAGAAWAADALASHGAGTLVGLVVVVSGGLVEGSALGVLQARALGALDRSARRRWALATVVVAGVGWAGASTPAVLSEDDGSGVGPPIGLVVLGAC